MLGDDNSLLFPIFLLINISTSPDEFPPNVNVILYIPELNTFHFGIVVIDIGLLYESVVNPFVPT